MEEFLVKKQHGIVRFSLFWNVSSILSVILQELIMPLSFLPQASVNIKKKVPNGTKKAEKWISNTITETIFTGQNSAYHKTQGHHKH